MTPFCKRLLRCISCRFNRKFCAIFMLILCSSILLTMNLTSRKQRSLLNTSTSVRICCLILTIPKNLLTRARAVHETWGPRCDRYFFVSDHFTISTNITPEQAQFIKQLPLLPVTNFTSGRLHLIQKVTCALLFLYEHYLHDFDWFVKADDDTYIILENLRTFLEKHNATQPVTFGYNFKLGVKDGYHSGGASYVLSQEALKRFHQGHRIPNNKDCQVNKFVAEDVGIARCLRSQNVNVGNSTDEYGRELFHPLPFGHHFTGGVPSWMRRYAFNPLRNHYNCCSDRTISFHYMSAADLYQFEFLLYKVRIR